MANNIDVTLKRFNGTDYDVILPTTHLGQLYTDSTLATSLSSWLSGTYINLNEKAAVSGVATLDSTGKIPITQFPAWAAGGGGMELLGSLSGTDSVETLLDVLETAFLAGGILATDYAGIASYARGKLFQVVQDFNWVQGIIDNSWVGTYTVQAPGDEGDYDVVDGGIDLENGDMVAIVKAVVNGSAVDITFGIVNNTYRNASTTSYGISRLSAKTTTETLSGTDVITESILSGLLVAEGSSLAGTTNPYKIAPAKHDHDNSYYVKTDINNWISGSLEINNDTYVPIKYGVGPITASVSGTIIIEKD